MVRLEDKSVRDPQVHGELTGSVSMERVAVSRHVVHVGKSRGRAKRRQAPLEDLPLLRPPTLRALPVVRARLLQPPVQPRDLDGGPLLDVNPRG